MEAISLGFFIFHFERPPRTPSWEFTERNSTKFCHIFSSEPGLKTVVPRGVPFLKTWVPKLPIFGCFYDDIAIK